MKKIIILFIFTFIYCGFSQNCTGLKLISMKYVQYDFRDFDQDISFEYNDNGTIHQFKIESKKFNLATEYFYKNDTIRSTYTKNSNVGLSSKSHFKYTNGKLSGETIEGVNPNIDKDKFIKTADIKYQYFEKKIIISKTYNIGSYSDSEEAILLDNKGNITKVEYSNRKTPKVTYDGKNDPESLVFPKYLLGHEKFGLGNKLTEGDKIIFKYKYNKFGYPIEQKKYEDGKLITMTTYKYNK